MKWGKKRRVEEKTRPGKRNTGSELGKKSKKKKERRQQVTVCEGEGKKRKREKRERDKVLAWLTVESSLGKYCGGMVLAALRGLKCGWTYCEGGGPSQECQPKGPACEELSRRFLVELKVFQSSGPLVS